MDLQEIIDELQKINSFNQQLDGEEVKSLLSSLWVTIYTEAWYDPYNSDTKRICHGMLTKIDRLNALLNFKE